MKKWQNEEIVELGSCSSPHGIRGAFTFNLLNSQDSSLKSDGQIILFPKSEKSNLKEEGEVFEIDKISFGHKTMVYLKGISDRNIVEAMVPFSIYILRRDLPALEEGEIYLYDLIGCVAIHIETGESLGKVVGIEDNGVQDILVIRGQEAMDLPYVDAFVGDVDLEKKTIKINPPEYV
jgi:16S rRNA processing protein RimM